MAVTPRSRRWFLLVAAIAAVIAVFLVRPGSVAPGVAVVSRPAKKSPVAAPTAPASGSGPAASAPAVRAVPVAAAPNALFAFVEPAGGAAALNAALPGPAREFYYVRLNRPLITGKQSPFWQRRGEGRMDLPLPDGRVLPILIGETESLGPDRFTSTGAIEGRPGSRAIFAYNNGFMHASVEDVELGSFALRAATEEISQFFQVDPALVAPCGGEVHPVIDTDAILTLAKRGAKTVEAPKTSGAANGADAGGPDAPATPPIANAAGANVQVQLMIAYTQSVRSDLTGTTRTSVIQSAIDAMVTQVNADLAASLVTARVKLVKTVQTSYIETGSQSDAVQLDALEALRQTTDGRMDELHALRDSTGADLVCLLLNRHDSKSIGIGYIFDTPGSNINPLFGFTVVEYDSGTIPSLHVVSHELGHNLGCAHDRDNSLGGHGAYPYSYGYRFTGANGLTYRDIMAYAPGTQLGYYSTPNVTASSPISRAVGVAAGLPGEADNARTIEQSAFEVANYRLQTETAFSLGTLQAVSTRAFVGDGDQQLIGGFIITGSEKKKVLLRAAGPALAPFLGNYLRDPFLTLYNVGGPAPVIVATNDNWETNSNRNEIGGLLGGSKDSALLLSLDPGAYTANITSSDGGTGTARIDAYEADGGGSRLFALSTRAYADTSTPMIAGFVVSGAAGTTKRMLIRVRGPSMLRDFGVGGAMFDPFMEIHNGTGELIMINDDWSSGSDTADDFTPYVTLYNEKQIANSQEVYQTGFAPANRREPAIMADFPPGTYTVVIRPFEHLPDQPQRPGVAAVDVFEINPH